MSQKNTHICLFSRRITPGPSSPSSPGVIALKTDAHNKFAMPRPLISRPQIDTNSASHGQHVADIDVSTKFQPTKWTVTVTVTGMVSILSRGTTPPIPTMRLSRLYSSTYGHSATGNVCCGARGYQSWVVEERRQAQVLVLRIISQARSESRTAV